MNSNIRKLILFAVLLPLHVTAQTLTLDECRKKAIEYNKSLSSAKLKLQQTQYDTRYYRSQFFPKIDIMATDFYSNASGDFTIDGGHLPIYTFSETAGKYVPSVKVNPDGSYQLLQYADFPSQTMKWKLNNVIAAGVSLMQPIYTGGKLSTALKMSRLGQDMAEQNIRLTKSEVIVQTDEAYILAVRAKQLGEVAMSYKSLLEELKKNVEGAFRHGMKTRNDIMKVQVKLNEVELNITKAENAYRLACMNLCHVIGMPLTTDVMVETTDMDMLMSDAEPVTDGFTTQRPEHIILERKTQLAEQSVRLAKSQHLPTVMAGASYTYNHGGELAGHRLLDGSSATIGVMVKIPVDVFGGSASKVKSAKVAYQMAQLEQQDSNEKMQLELIQATNNLNESLTEVQICEKSLEQAAENMRLSRQQYEVGFEPLSDYLESQSLWQQASANLVQARCQYLLSITKYRKAKGELCTSD